MSIQGHNDSVWIALVEVRPRAGKEQLLDGALGAYVSVVALAENAHDYQTRARSLLSGMGFDVTEIENVEPLADRVAHTRPEQAVLDLASQLTPNNPVAVGAFDAYETE
ncbi:MAG: hypothetical protein AAGJ56_10390 [Myxococcota bacterium]